VGRDDLLEKIEVSLGDLSNEAVIVLRGPAGVGKSELAREFGRRHQNRYPGGSFLVDAGTGAISVDLARIGRACLGLDFPSDLSIEDQGMRTLAALGQNSTLLIFDNVRSIEIAKSILPPAGMPFHIVITTLLDRWDATGWHVLPVEPLSEDASMQLIESLAGHDVAQQHGRKLMDLAGGLPVQLVPNSATLAYEVRRGRSKAVPLTLQRETSQSFRGVYDQLEAPAQLLLHAAARLNYQRVIVDELKSHLTEGCGWSEAEFQRNLDTCMDVHVLQGITEISMHQLFAMFIRGIDLPEEVAVSLQSVRNFQFQRMAELARELGKAPNRTDLAASVMIYPIDPNDWTEMLPNLSSKANMIGHALFEIGQFAAALQWFERAVAAKEKGDIHGRVDNESLGSSLNWVGTCLIEQGEHAAALPWLERAVAASEKGDIHGRVDHEGLSKSLRAGARCLKKLGQAARAKEWERRANET
jgi:tetratricopeptide (TPR) repeat protein